MAIVEVLGQKRFDIGITVWPRPAGREKGVRIEMLVSPSSAPTYAEELGCQHRFRGSVHLERGSKHSEIATL